MRLASLALLLLLPLAVSVAQDPSDLSAQERWDRLTPKEQALLQERFLIFLKLSPEERARLKKEGRRIELGRETSLRGLSVRERALLDELEPDLRRRIVRDLFRQRRLDDGSRVRDKLPPHFVRELEAADPSERGPMFEAFLQARRLSDGRRLLLHLGEELEISENEQDHWDAFTLEEQRAKLLELGRVFIRKRVDEYGPPRGLDEDRWETVDALGDGEFYEIWRRLSPSPEYVPQPSLAAPVEGIRGDQPDAVESAMEERPGVAKAEERRRLHNAWRELRDLSQFDVRDYLTVAGGERSQSERFEAMAALVRERTLDHIRSHELMEEEKLETLEALKGREYINALRRTWRAYFSRRVAPSR